MSKKILTVVVGVALIAFASPLAFILIANTGLAAIGSAALFSGITMAIVAVGASIMGSALAPDPVDQESAESYAGTKLGTILNNVSAVPVIFGENKVGSAIIFQDTGSYPPPAMQNFSEDLHGYNRNYMSIQVIGEGEIDSFTEVWAGTKQMSPVPFEGASSSAPYYSSEFGCEVGHYSLTADNTVFVTTYTNSGAAGISLSDVCWLQRDRVAYGSQWTSTYSRVRGDYIASDLAGFWSAADIVDDWDHLRIPPNVAYMTIHQIYDAEDQKFTSLLPINPIVKGLPLRPTNSSGFGTAAYSDNPVDQVAQLLTDGLNIPDVDIDFPSFAVARAACISYGYTSNIVFNQRRNIQSEIKDILATCRGQVSYSQGKWIMHIDTKGASVVRALTADDILKGSLSISMVDFASLANKLTTTYINPADEWLSAEVYSEANTLDLVDGQELTANLNIKGVTNSVQATKLGQIALNTMRYSEDANGDRLKQTPLMISFGTTVRHADLEVGDVISLDHDLIQRVRKFVLTSIKTDQSGAMEVSAREYCDTHYVDSNGYDII